MDVELVVLCTKLDFDGWERAGKTIMKIADCTGKQKLVHATGDNHSMV